MSYTLSFADRFKRAMETPITSDTSGSVAFASLPDNEPTKLVTYWTGKQFTKLLSSVMAGADLMFPDEADEIVWQLIKTIHLPQELPISETGCYAYTNTAPFISYFPNNPLSDKVPSGYLLPAWTQFGLFDSIFPNWINDWINNQIESFTGYQSTDILCNIASFPINTVQAFLDNGGIFPKIEVRFSGTGVVDLELLSFPLGGKAIIELDSEPNILDILTGGIIDPSAFEIELDRDILSFPPDEYPINNVKIPVTTTGDHVLYIVFIPVIDDSTTFLRLGGGIRSVELCGFSEVGTVNGIDAVIWDGCALKTVSNGVETTVVTALEIQNCLDLPEILAGGFGNVRANVYSYTLTSDVNVTNTGFNGGIIGTGTTHNFFYPNAIIHAKCDANGASGVDVFTRPIVNGVAASTYAASRKRGASVSGSVSAASWVNVNPLVQNGAMIGIEAHVNSGTGVILSNSDIVLTIIEYENASEIYVQDVRIYNGELQKKIALSNFEQQNNPLLEVNYA